MRDARTNVPRPPGQPPPAPPPPAPPSAGPPSAGPIAVPMPRRPHSRAMSGTPAAALRVAACILALVRAQAAAANTPPAGVLLRQARYALAEGDSDRARDALRSACAAEPGSARGVEAALLLATLEFGRGDRAAAESALVVPGDLSRALPSGTDALAIARGWIALGSDDPASARRAFAAAASSPDLAARDLATLGGAWASLASAEPVAAIAILGPVARTSPDPILRTAAQWSLARAHAAAGDPRRARHALRGLRRLARTTSFADDVELDLALSELSAGDTRAARRTILRLRALPGRASGPARAPGESPTLADLRLPPRAFVARLAALFANRARGVESPVEFLRRALDRDARADADEALRLVIREEGGRS